MLYVYFLSYFCKHLLVVGISKYKSFFRNIFVQYSINFSLFLVFYMNNFKRQIIILCYVKVILNSYRNEMKYKTLNETVKEIIYSKSTIYSSLKKHFSPIKNEKKIIYSFDEWYIYILFVVLLTITSILSRKECIKWIVKIHLFKIIEIKLFLIK